MWSFLPCMMINWFCLLFFFGMGKTNSSVSTYRSESLVILLLIFNWLQCNTSSIRNSSRLSPSEKTSLGKGARSSGWYLIDIHYWCSARVAHFLFLHVVFCRSLFVFLSFWSLYCLFFCLLVIVLSVLQFKFSAFDNYSFCILKLFWYPSNCLGSITLLPYYYHAPITSINDLKEYSLLST